MPHTSSGHERGEKIEFENDRVRVIRIIHKGRETKAAPLRRDRVLIWVTDSHHSRMEENGRKEEIHRKAGEVAWRAASEHTIEHHNDGDAELIIVELKDASTVSAAGRS